ncbi:heme exporter protein B [Agaribacter marinus]|uniref:Heme exporter protein B n=1 Tax=Agaribacter marinus TaxID=1431249 RepID=A0AA37SWK7_9ALTE|nr:heme exporter protein B [Agaribacter marinus]
MGALVAVFHRELALSFRQRSELMQPVMFFLIVISLFPLAIGPGAEILQRVSGGVIWVAAILSLLLGMERLFRDDFTDGSMEQYLLSSTPAYLIVLVKVFAHWLVSILPLVLLSPLLAMFLNMTWDMYWVLLYTLLLGTPTISLIGAIGVSLTVSLQRSGVLLPLILLPLFIPLLIFSTSAIESVSLQLPYGFQIGIMLAILLFTLALAPAAIAYSLRVSLN